MFWVFVPSAPHSRAEVLMPDVMVLEGEGTWEGN